MTGLILELRRGTGKWIFLPLAILGIYAAEAVLPTGRPAQWALTVSALGTSVMLMGPIAAATAAYAGGSSRRRRMGSWEALSTRGAAAAGLTALAAISLWVLAAFVVVLVVVFGRTAASATWSGPDIPRTLATGLGLTLQAVLGYLAGRAVPRRFTPVVVATLFYALSVLSNSATFGHRWQLLIPVNLQLYDGYNRLNLTVAPGQIAWYVGAAGLAATVWAFLRGRSSGLRAPLAGFTLLALVGAGVLVAQDGRGNRPGVFVTWTCSGHAPQLCLHPALRSVRPALDAQLVPVAARLAGTPFELRRVEQRPRGLGSAPSPGAVAFALDDGRPQSVRQAVQDVVIRRLGLEESCYRPQDGSLRPGYPYAAIVAASVLGTPGLAIYETPTQGRAAVWLHTLSTEQERSWLTQKEGKIRSCELRATDFA